MPDSNQEPNSLAGVNNHNINPPNQKIETPNVVSGTSNVISLDDTTGRPNKNKKMILLSIFGVIILSLSVAVGVYLVQRQQDIRRDAARISPIPCLIDPAANRQIFNFNEKMIRSDKNEDQARTSVIPISLDAGEYKVILSSYDDHSDKNGAQNQTNEIFYVVLVDENGNEVVRTNNISDLPNDQDFLVEEVNSSLVISEKVFGMFAYHAAYPERNANSIVPVCAAFELIVEEEPTPTPTTVVEASPTPTANPTTIPTAIPTEIVEKVPTNTPVPTTTPTKSPVEPSPTSTPAPIAQAEDPTPTDTGKIVGTGAEELPDAGFSNPVMLFIFSGLLVMAGALVLLF